MKREVRLDVIYPHPPERVWKAITDRDALQKWLMPNDFQPRLGHRFQFLKDAPDKRNRRVIHCEVVELDAPHRLAFTWRSEPDGPPDLVSWTLEPVEAGTRLRLEHIAVEGLAPFQAHFDPRWQSRLSHLLADGLVTASVPSYPRGRISLNGLTCRGIVRRTRRFTNV